MSCIVHLCEESESRVLRKLWNNLEVGRFSTRRLVASKPDVIEFGGGNRALHRVFSTDRARFLDGKCCCSSQNHFPLTEVPRVTTELFPETQ